MRAFIFIWIVELLRCPTSGPSSLTWSQGVWRVSLLPFPSSKMLRKMDPHWISGWCVFMFSSHTWRTFTKKVTRDQWDWAIRPPTTKILLSERLGNISKFMNMWINKLLQGTHCKDHPKKASCFKSSWIPRHGANGKRTHLKTRRN